MTYVITTPCIDVKDGDCVACCPVDCIYEGARMFYIQPDECINCGLCVSVCPVDAIYEVDKLPAALGHYLRINRDYFGAAVSGLGSPKCAEGHGRDLDHPEVAQHPHQSALPHRTAG